MLKKSNFQLIGLVTLLTILSMLLSACQPAVAPTASEPAGSVPAATNPTSTVEVKPVKLVVASWWNIDKAGGWDGMVAKFKQDHPGVEIELQVTPWNEYRPKLLTQIASGDAPDVAGVEVTPFPAFVSRNMLMDLTPFLSKSADYSTKDFFSRLMDRYTYDGKVYGIPNDAQPFGLLFYNPKLFDEAGVAYPTNQWTWNDALAAAKKLTKTDASGTIATYGIATNIDERIWLYSFGGDYVDDLRHPTKSLLDQKPAMDGIQFMVDLMYKDKVMADPAVLESLGGRAQDLFTSGNAAMLVSGFWITLDNPDGFKSIGAKMVMAPAGPDGTRKYLSGGTAYAILRTSKNAELAWEFIKYFLGPVGYQEAYKSAKLGGMAPPAYIPSFDWYMTQPIGIVDTLQPNKDALQYVTFPPYTENWPEIESKCIAPDMDLIKRNQKPVDETMISISKCINDMLKP